ncbi:hypothetical protein J7W19_06270 [Streptomyces mobaraensis NBRC 13819 = DSM 40847]|uniref:hypothetical protein n=1 Tax=Streptomyces mobaraensis TaxID=35621 RepID=UPI00034BBEB9|nr:hypothetical protein [Streptomyces mobaraensis]QTT73081.1 hypothetical protein J7W19_06270 [Streptomyces mobaraensis NBRC 13819 = DSM 40847]
MTPPPPLGRSRLGGGPTFDSALDDTELVTVRDELARGRWAEARRLLAETGDDWDLRGHRLTTLAAVSTSTAWGREWLLAEPDSADASALLACAAVHRAVRRKSDAESARGLCRAAARMAPRDPTPWLGLLLLAHAGVTDDEPARCFGQVRARHPEHHHAHHLMAACLAGHKADHDDPLHEVYDFAAWAAEQAPADSPLALLPVVAHAERFRALARAGTLPRDPAASGHWAGRRARQVLKTAFDWWLEWDVNDTDDAPEAGGVPGAPRTARRPAAPPHPRHKVDLNFLAHAKLHEGRLAEAAALLIRIGPHVTREPWAYPDRDPKAAYRAARRTALGSR